MGFQRQVEPSAAGLALASEALAAWLAAQGAPAAGLGRVELVLEEVAMNVIMHGAPTDGSAPRLQLAAAALPDGCRLVLSDNGPPFDQMTAPLRRQAASLEQDSPGGLGLVLLRRFARDQAYQRLADGNVLALTVPYAASPA